MPNSNIINPSSVYSRFLQRDCYAVISKKTRERLAKGLPVPKWTMVHIIARMRKLGNCNVPPRVRYAQVASTPTNIEPSRTEHLLNLGLSTPQFHRKTAAREQPRARRKTAARAQPRARRKTAARAQPLNTNNGRQNNANNTLSNLGYNNLFEEIERRFPTTNTTATRRKTAARAQPLNTRNSRKNIVNALPARRDVWNGPRTNNEETANLLQNLVNTHRMQRRT